MESNVQPDAAEAGRVELESPRTQSARRNAVTLSKGGAEMRKVRKAGFTGDVLDRAVRFDEECVGALEALPEHESVDGFSPSRASFPA